MKFHCIGISPQDLLTALVPVLLPVVFQSLQDRDDDVRAVAAAALLPATDCIISAQIQEKCGIKVGLV